MQYKIHLDETTTSSRSRGAVDRARADRVCGRAVCARDRQRIGDDADDRFKGPKGYEVGYALFSINGRMLGHGEPIRVKAGERVLFHVLNASATEIRSLALPGHTFLDLLWAFEGYSQRCKSARKRRRR